MNMVGSVRSIINYRNGWGIEAREIKEEDEKLEVEIINRERDLQR